MRPDLLPTLQQTVGDAALAAIKTLRVSQVPPPYAAMVPAECR
jgi:hypothetical protein